MYHFSKPSQCNNLQADDTSKGYSLSPLLCLPMLLKTPEKSLLKQLLPHASKFKVSWWNLTSKSLLQSHLRPQLGSWSIYSWGPHARLWKTVHPQTAIWGWTLGWDRSVCDFSKCQYFPPTVLLLADTARSTELTVQLASSPFPSTNNGASKEGNNLLSVLMAIDKANYI